MTVKYTLVFLNPSGRAKSTWPVGTAIQLPATDTLAWIKPKRLSEAGPVDDGLRLGRWTPDASGLGAKQLAEIKRLARLSEAGPVDDGLRLGRWTPNASGLGAAQLGEIKRLLRLSEAGPVDDGLRLGRWTPNVPIVVDTFAWIRCRRLSETGPVDDGFRLCLWPVATAVQKPATDTLAWIKPKRLSEAGPIDDGLRLGRWTPDASGLGAKQLAEIKRLIRLSEAGPVDDGLRLGRWSAGTAVQTPTIDMLAWIVPKRLSAAGPVDDGGLAFKGFLFFQPGAPGGSGLRQLALTGVGL